MAISADSYFSNSIVGTPGVGADIDLYGSSTSPKYQIGFGFTRADGNKYRYCHFGALTAAGLVVATDESESSGGLYPNCGAVLANRAKPDNNGVYVNAVGSRWLQLVITATDNQFAGGYVFCDSNTAITYRIRSNTATSDGRPVTGNILMELYEPLVVAIDSNSDLRITGCPYANVEPGIGTSDVNAVGIAVVGNTAGSFGWICSAGMVAALQDATAIGTSTGYPVYLSTTTVGTITTAVQLTSYNALGILNMIGTMVSPGSPSDYSMIRLRLE